MKETKRTEEEEEALGEEALACQFIIYFY